MDERVNRLIAYFKQQSQLDVPPHIFSDVFSVQSILGEKSRVSGRTASAPAIAAAPGANRRASGTNRPRQAAMPLPAHAFMRNRQTADAPPKPPSSTKRTNLAGLFRETKTCQKCALGKLRKSFVFGTGNPDARFMIVGGAPGDDEDRQGLPFAGAAGDLLAKMLAAIDIDRTKQAFISNVVKCKPPENRNPEHGEILACSDLLARQIEIIAPSVMLLLGEVASHALLNSTENIAALRERNGLHFFKKIPVFVTYDPADLLRNDGYRRPAWEDLKKLQKTLKDSGMYDVAPQ